MVAGLEQPLTGGGGAFLTVVRSVSICEADRIGHSGSPFPSLALAARLTVYLGRIRSRRSPSHDGSRRAV